MVGGGRPPPPPPPPLLIVGRPLSPAVRCPLPGTGQPPPRPAGRPAAAAAVDGWDGRLCYVACQGQFSQLDPLTHDSGRATFASSAELLAADASTGCQVVEKAQVSFMPKLDKTGSVYRTSCRNCRVPLWQTACEWCGSEDGAVQRPQSLHLSLHAWSAALGLECSLNTQPAARDSHLHITDIFGGDSTVCTHKSVHMRVHILVHDICTHFRTRYLYACLCTCPYMSVHKPVHMSVHMLTHMHIAGAAASQLTIP